MGDGCQEVANSGGRNKVAVEGSDAKNSTTDGDITEGQGAGDTIHVRLKGCIIMTDFFGELKRDMWDLSRRSLEPLTSVWETKDKVVVEIDLPLVEKDNIQLRLMEDSLEVEASLARTVRYHRWGTVQMDCEFMFLHKVIPLPSLVVSEGSVATFKSGILRVEIRKRKDREHRITIE